MSEIPPPPPIPRAAFCEEFNEDAQTTVPETRQTASSANIAAKRSKPDTAKGKPVRDEFSDSGYSSHTAATLGSGDSSSLESRQEAQPVRHNDTSTESSATVKEGAKGVKSRSQSPEKPSLRRAGSKNKGYETSRPKNCECPECLAKKAQRVTPPNIDTSRAPPVAARPRKEPLSPISPQGQRKPRPYPPPEAPILQAAPVPRTRAVPTQSYQQPRPMSFHGGALPDMSYMQHPVFVDNQPVATYATSAPFAPPSYPLPHPSYLPPLQPVASPPEFYPPVAPMASPYEVQPRQRPRVSARPQSMYYESSQPTMEHTQPAYQPLRSPDHYNERQSRRRQPPTLRKESTEESDDYHRMPPPPPRKASKSRQEQRPVIRHAATTSAAYVSSHQRSSSRDLGEGGSASRPTSRKQSFEGPPHSRRPSAARPLRTSDERVAQALQHERDRSRIDIVERDPVSVKGRRRVSVYGHESLKDLEGSVEAYQASKAGRESSSIPTADEMLRLMRKNKLPTSAGSDAGSRKSGGSKASRDGSDIKSTRHSGTDLKRHDSNEEKFAMRIPKGANVNLQAGMEGRPISLRQSRDGDGDMELRIGERGRAATSGPTRDRPVISEESRRRYSVVGGQAIAESEQEREPRLEEPSKTITRRRESKNRPLEDKRYVERDVGYDGQRRIVRERIITRTTNRSRRSSRGAYDSRDRNVF